MKRILILTAVLAASAIFSAAPASARAGSCSGVLLFPPTLGGGVTTEWRATCTVVYDVVTVPQYFVPPNLWNHATKNGGTTVATRTDAQNPANIQATVSGTFQGLDQTPYCSFDWRQSVTIKNHATGATIWSGISPVLHATC